MAVLTFRNVLILLIVFFAYWANHVRIVMEFSKELDFTQNHSCKTLRGPVGAEDFVRWGSLVFSSNLDALNLWEWPKRGGDTSDPTTAQGGDIYVVRGIGTEDLSLEKAELVGFPEGVAFHPHGLGLLSKGNILLVVNHAYANGGERVDSFDISEVDGKVRLTYRSTTRFDECCMGILNDVTPVSENEFYVTTYMPYPDETEGRGHGAKFVQIMYMISPIPFKKTHIYYCKGSGSFNEVCKIVGLPGRGYNGITSNPDKTQIYVNDALRKTIVRFDRDSDNNLVNPKEVTVPHVSDNIYYEEEDGKIWAAGIAQGYLGVSWFVPYVNHPGVLPTGGSKLGEFGCPSHVSSLDFESGITTTHFVHDGSLLNCAAGAQKFGNYFVVGSFVDNGILVCPLKQ